MTSNLPDTLRTAWRLSFFDKPGGQPVHVDVLFQQTEGRPVTADQIVRCGIDQSPQYGPRLAKVLASVLEDDDPEELRIEQLPQWRVRKLAAREERRNRSSPDRALEKKVPGKPYTPGIAYVREHDRNALEDPLSHVDAPILHGKQPTRQSRWAVRRLLTQGTYPLARKVAGGVDGYDDAELQKALTLWHALVLQQEKSLAHGIPGKGSKQTKKRRPRKKRTKR